VVAGLNTEGEVIRRVVAANNHCLFTSLGYLWSTTPLFYFTCITLFLFIYSFIYLFIYIAFILLNRYVLEDHNRDAGLKLRQVIADVVKSGTLFDPTPKRVGPTSRRMVQLRASPDPETYNAVFLDQSNEDYVKFILNPESWGGTLTPLCASLRLSTRLTPTPHLPASRRRHRALDPVQVLPDGDCGCGRAEPAYRRLRPRRRLSRGVANLCSHAPVTT